MKLYRDLLLRMFFMLNPAQGTTCVLKTLHLDTIAVKQLLVYKAHSSTLLTENQTKNKNKERKVLQGSFMASS